MILLGHHLSHPWNFWLLQVPGMDDSKGLKMDQKTLTCTLHVHRNLYPFLACRRSAAGAVGFTCSRSLAIAFSLLVVALWKMESWKNLLRIFIPKFSRHFKFVLCFWKRICLTVWIHLQVATPSKGQASPRLACLCQAFRCNQAILQSRDYEQTEEPKMYHKEQGLKNPLTHSEEDIKMAGLEV